jgi:hypothetical protein
MTKAWPRKAPPVPFPKAMGEVMRGARSVGTEALPLPVDDAGLVAAGLVPEPVR